jgi:hypothetical protein
LIGIRRRGLGADSLFIRPWKDVPWMMPLEVPPPSLQLYSFAASCPMCRCYHMVITVNIPVQVAVKTDGIRNEDIKSEVGIFSLNQKNVRKQKWKEHHQRMDGTCIPTQAMTYIVQ